MIMTRDANKITKLVGLIIMLASKNFKSNRLLGIFGRSNDISKTVVKYRNQLWMNGYSISVKNYLYGYSCGKNCKAVSSKDSRDNREYFEASCNNKINRE